MGFRLLRICAFITFCLLTSMAFSQEAKDNSEIEVEVNRQLWKPFKIALENRDWETFNELHTDDVLRVNKWGIKQGDTYKESVKRRYQKKDDINRTIDFCLEHRIYSGNIGYEVGFYRIKNTLANGEVKESYARFHIVLKKIEGEWKIAQDWDTGTINDIPISEADFAKGTLLEL